MCCDRESTRKVRMTEESEAKPLSAFQKARALFEQQGAKGGAAATPEAVVPRLAWKPQGGVKLPSSATYQPSSVPAPPLKAPSEGITSHARNLTTGTTTTTTTRSSPTITAPQQEGSSQKAPPSTKHAVVQKYARLVAARNHLKSRSPPPPPPPPPPPVPKQQNSAANPPTPTNCLGDSLSNPGSYADDDDDEEKEEARITSASSSPPAMHAAVKSHQFSPARSSASTQDDSDITPKAVNTSREDDEEDADEDDSHLYTDDLVEHILNDLMTDEDEENESPRQSRQKGERSEQYDEIWKELEAEEIAEVYLDQHPEDLGTPPPINRAASSTKHPPRVLRDLAASPFSEANGSEFTVPVSNKSPPRKYSTPQLPPSSTATNASPPPGPKRVTFQEEYQNTKQASESTPPESKQTRGPTPPPAPRKMRKKKKISSNSQPRRSPSSDNDSLQSANSFNSDPHANDPFQMIWGKILEDDQINNQHSDIESYVSTESASTHGSAWSSSLQSGVFSSAGVSLDKLWTVFESKDGSAKSTGIKNQQEDSSCANKPMIGEWEESIRKQLDSLCLGVSGVTEEGSKHLQPILESFSDVTDQKSREFVEEVQKIPILVHRQQNEMSEQLSKLGRVLEEQIDNLEQSLPPNNLQPVQPFPLEEKKMEEELLVVRPEPRPEFDSFSSDIHKGATTLFVPEETNELHGVEARLAKLATQSSVLNDVDPVEVEVALPKKSVDASAATTVDTSAVESAEDSGWFSFEGSPFDDSQSKKVHANLVPHPGSDLSELTEPPNPKSFMLFEESFAHEDALMESFAFDHENNVFEVVTSNESPERERRLNPGKDTETLYGTGEADFEFFENLSINRIEV